MVARVQTIAFRGIDVLPIDVEVQIMPGLPAFTIVGLPNKAVDESRERVRSALNSMGLSLPAKRITVNLAPADVLKEGSHFDLPIAVGLLTAMDIIPKHKVEQSLIVGELGLDGRIAPVSGVLPAAIAATGMDCGFICPGAQGSEAAWAGNEDILAPDHLLALINHFKEEQFLPKPKPAPAEEIAGMLDMKDVKGQESAKRAMEIAGAGGHNVLMIGPPGAGKSMIAARLPGLLPPLETEEILEVSMIHSVAGLLKDGKLVTDRPFRFPHHSASMPALVGGGMKAKPGEISLAHRGILFLDELPEFQRQALEALRQPLETGQVSVARANLHVTYPARFQLIAAMNPCRCGYLGVSGHECARAPRCGDEYAGKLSGPLLDRIDMHVDVGSVPAWKLSGVAEGEPSKDIASRIKRARNIQKERYRNKGVSLMTNSEADGPLLDEVVVLSDEAKSLLIDAAQKMNLSARGYHRILRVARTIADLAEEMGVHKNHVTEALSFRRIMYK